MEEKFDEIMGLRTRYATLGSGFPVIAIPGFPFSLKVWSTIAPGISEKFKIYCLDLPGFAGETQNSTKEHTIDLYINFIDEFIRKKGFKKVNLLGQSMGGFMSLEYAFRHPDKVNKIATCAPAYFDPVYIDKNLFRKVQLKFIKNMVLNHTKPVDYLYRALKTKFGLNFYYLKYPRLKEVDRNLVIDMYEDMIKMDNGPMIEMFRDYLKQDYRDQFKTIKVETLVLSGERDRVVYPESCRILAEEVLPNGVFESIPNGYHDSAVTDGKFISDKINEFFLAS